MLLLILIAVLVASLALYLHQTYTWFSSHGVKHLTPFPFFGNMLKIVFGSEHFVDGLNQVYKDNPNDRFVGRYEFTKPTILVRDLDLVKRIAIIDFEHFVDHRSFIDPETESFFAKNLVSLKGQEWKDMRSTLSPAFTSSKVKQMVPFIQKVSNQMLQALNRKIDESPSGSIELDVKDLTSRFTNDVIASCAFGLKVDSYNDEDNQFYKMRKEATQLKIRQWIRFFLVGAFPTLAKALKLRIFSPYLQNFFIDLVTTTMKGREVRKIIRPDMIHLLMQAKKGKLTHDGQNDNQKDIGFATVQESDVGLKTVDRKWSDSELIAQAVLFYIAGFETISTVMSFTLRELALNPEIQDRLVQEIKETNAKNDGKLDFSSLQSMTYLDMVTSESLRKWPPILTLDRVCVKDYNMGKPNPKEPKDYVIRKGDILTIPVWSFHRDPKIYPNPEKFDPERFSEENKHKINPMTFLPFGIGPRNCIGSRFALCELKVLLYQVLLHMEVSPSEKTCISNKLAPDSFTLRLYGGNWLGFKRRS